MSRGLLTDKERMALRGEIDDVNQRSTYIARVKQRMNDRVTEDIEILKEHQPELYESLRQQIAEVEDD